PSNVCPAPSMLTAPMMGAAKSVDNGANWTDLGAIIQAPRGSTDCTSQDRFFAGGNGDFSVILNAQQTFVYFFFSSYAGDLSGQGVAVARMDWQFRDNPAGNVWKWYQGSFSQPGKKGLLTATFPPAISWMQSTGGGYWGPSVHWNTYLNQYVMLLNNVFDSSSFKQEGIYISYSSNLDDPTSWSAPQKILDSSQFYFNVPGNCPAGLTCKAR